MCRAFPASGRHHQETSHAGPTRVQRRLPVRRDPLPGARRADRQLDLPLPDVPEGLRCLLRAAGVGARRAVQLDPRPAALLPVVQRGPAGILCRLWHPADLRGARRRGNRCRRLRPARAPAADDPVRGGAQAAVRRRAGHPAGAEHRGRRRVAGVPGHDRVPPAPRPRHPALAAAQSMTHL
ncbi:hypothetical protein G6F57_014967 [Rhizopus arrhizus]|nr:hypothetical protein G6F57_014967 [Rhizopus arrhizus]